jgi:hypothetical protein
MGVINMNLYTLFVVAAITEAVWETLKMTWQKGKGNVNRIGSLVVGIIIALSTGSDILLLTDIPSKVPYIGVILTGILISRGSNIVHDVFASISNMYSKTKALTGGTPLDKTP